MGQSSQTSVQDPTLSLFPSFSLSLSSSAMPWEAELETMLVDDALELALQTVVNAVLQQTQDQLQEAWRREADVVCNRESQASAFADTRTAETAPETNTIEEGANEIANAHG